MPGSIARTGRNASPDRPRIAVLGTGQMGLVCAGILGSPDGTKPHGADVVLWGRSTDETAMLLQTRTSPRLPEFQLPPEVEVCLRLESAVQGATTIVSAIPVQFVRDVWRRLPTRISPGAGIISVAKGVETTTLLRVTEVIKDTLDEVSVPRPIGCLSGPTIAPELARCLPAAMVAASSDPAFAAHIQSLFTTSWLRVYTNHDLVGVELAGAVKNVIAIAAGIIDGLDAGNNAKSALLARGLAEISRLGVALGASPETFYGIAGVGDLATSCFSREGRNRTCGEAVGRGVPLETHLASTPYVVEGVQTCRAVLELATSVKVEMPIVAAVHAVLFENLDPIEAIASLMTRGAKSERVG